MNVNLTDPTTGLPVDISSLTYYAAVTPGSDTIAQTRALIASEACTVNLTRPDGVDVDGFPLAAGVPIAIACIKVRAVSAGTVFVAS
jgi:hypothetical protein